MTIADYDPEEHLFATRYLQGNRTVFSLNLSLAQVAALVPAPDPDQATEGNRIISVHHASKFAEYVRTRPAWVAPALLFRAPDVFRFQPDGSVGGSEFGVLSFRKMDSASLKILDGQHRILGIHLARISIADDLEKRRSALLDAQRNGDQRSMAAIHKGIDDLGIESDRFSKERIALHIYVEDDAAAYRQMFFDIANNAMGIKASVKARFDSSKVINRGLPSIIDHPLLLNRVDPDQDRVTGGNQNLLGLNQVAEISRTLVVGLDGRISRRQEDELNEAVFVNVTRRFLDVLTASFPPLADLVSGTMKPNELRRLNLLGSTVTLRVLAGTYRELSDEHSFTDADITGFFSLIAPHMGGPITEDSIWINYVGKEVFSVGALAPTSRRQNLKMLKDHLVDWATSSPTFLIKTG